MILYTQPDQLIRWFFFIFLFLSLMGEVNAQDEKDMWQKKWSFQELESIEIWNPRGPLEVQAWAMDRIRVKVPGLSPKENVPLRVEQENGHVKMMVHYGEGLSLREKLKKRDAQKKATTLRVLVPSSVPLKLYSKKHPIKVEGYEGTLELRTQNGEIDLTDFERGSMRLQCVECEMNISKVEATTMNLYMNQGKMKLEDVNAESLSAELKNGNLQGSQIHGKQIYSLAKGKAVFEQISGETFFQVDQGRLKVLGGSGSLSVKSLSAYVSVHNFSWRLTQPTLISNHQGKTEIGFKENDIPPVKLEAKQGKVHLGKRIYPYIQTREKSLDQPYLSFITQQGNLHLNILQ